MSASLGALSPIGAAGPFPRSMLVSRSMSRLFELLSHLALLEILRQGYELPLPPQRDGKWPASFTLVVRDSVTP